MKLLNTMFDNLLKVEYKLYEVNAKELHKRLFKGYKMSNLQLQLFNSDIDLVDNINCLKSEKKRFGKIEEGSWRLKKLKRTIKEIHENTHIIGMNNIGVQFGYEMSPIVVSVEGDFENQDAKLELIDGFKRMFCSREVPNIDVLVKVYTQLDDTKWISSMIMYNSWKFSDGENCQKYMDRGFQLGLYYRYGIKFLDMDLIRYDMFSLINIYTNGRDLDIYREDKGSGEETFYTLWNNGQFIQDLMAMYKIFTYKPIFQVKKRGGKIEEYNFEKDGEDNYRNFRDGISRLYEVFISILGEIRKYELRNGVVDRIPFDINIFYDYITDASLQKHFLKLTQMEVDGHICNYIRHHLRAGIKERIYTKMGYEYTAPKPIEPVRAFIITEDML